MLVCDTAIKFFEENANPGERFKFTIDRIGKEKFERAMEIAITVTSENCDAPYDELVSRIFIELNKNDLVEYYDIITKLMCETRNHLRISNDL